MTDDGNHQPPHEPADANAPADAQAGVTPPDGAMSDAAAPPPEGAPPSERAHHHRRILNRRNAIITAGALAAALVLVALVGTYFYRSGRVDEIIREQIVSTLDEYGIRAEVEGFETQLGARTAVIRNLVLYDKQTGARLGTIRQLTARIRIEDLYALSLKRNVDLEKLAIDGLDLQVAFDEQGRSNFANIVLPAPDPNRRILFSYSTAEIEITNSVVRYDDERYDLAGEARNLRLTIIPDNPDAPEASRMNRVALAMSDSTLALDGERIEPIDVNLQARVDQVSAQIQELTIRSPLTESRLTGTLDDWRNLRYKLDVRSNVDLAEAARIARADVAVRGAGEFVGTVSGEGTRYQVEGKIASDALAAADVRLKGLTLDASARGDGSAYEAQGRAVAEILTAGDFRLSFVQLAGNVMGTGSDFRWLGELRAAAARSGATSIGELIIRDAIAEQRDGRFTASANRLSAASFTSEDLRAGGVQVAGVRVAQEANDAVSFAANSANVGAINSGTTRVGGAQVTDLRGRRASNGSLSFTARGARTGEIRTPDAAISGAQVSDLRADVKNNGAITFAAREANTRSITTNDATIAGARAAGITGTRSGATTNVQVARVQTGGVRALGAQIGSLNIAGVRLAIRDSGRIEGSSGDINAGTVALNVANRSGRIENVRVRRPVFTVEPAGRYRVTADLSLGGGVLGELRLGGARSSVIATNNELTLRDLNADVLGGNVRGEARIATNRGGRSVLDARFENLDIGNLLAFAGGQIVPVRGATTGSVDLTFPGTDFARATGTLDATIEGSTGDDAAGRTPITGRVALQASNGDFRIDTANLQAGSATLAATGRFSIAGDSDLALDVRSPDAAELQRVLLATGLAPDVENALADFGAELRGDIQLNAAVRGALLNPEIDGSFRVATLAVGDRPLGALAGRVALTGTEVRITDGSLREPDGGSIAFAASVPRDGSNTTAIDATLDRFSAGSLVAALPVLRNAAPSFDSEVSGKLNVTGLPSAASGAADLSFSAGTLAGEAFDSIVARATFAGSTLTLDTIDARFRDGRVTASGTADTRNFTFDLNARGESVNLDLVTRLAGGAAPSLPRVGGTADFTARVARTLDGTNADGSNKFAYNADFDAAGRDVTVNGQSAGALTLVGRTAGQQLDVRLTTGLLGTSQTITARVDFADPRLPATINFPIAGADLTPLFAAFLPPGTNVRVTGRATGDITVTGNLLTENEDGELAFSPRGLRGTAQFTELGFQIEDVRLDSDSPLVVQFSGDEVVFERTRFTGTGTNVVFGGTLALGAGGRQNLTIDGDINLRILNGFSPDVFAAGTSQIAVRVAGTFDRPQLTGTASLRDAGLSALVGDDRLVASGITGAVRFNQNQAQINSLTGRLGGGRFSVDGGALLDGLSLSQFRFTLRGDNISLPLPRDIRATADADIVAQGTREVGQIITGTVTLRRAEYTETIDLADLIDRRAAASLSAGGGGGDDGDGGGLFDLPTRLDIRVEGRDALVVRNNLADATASVSLQILGTLDTPLIAGRVSAARGTLTFRGERYEITRAFVDLPARADANLLVNIAAEADIAGYRVFVSLVGELSESASPQVTVRSDPALPQADVVALITTGQLGTDGVGGSTLAGAGVSTATGLLTDALINAPVQRATDRLFGLNVFEVSPISSGANGVTLEPQITVGRQVNGNLRVTYSTRLAAAPSQIVALDYRISDRLSFVARYETGNTQRLGTRGDEFSFELRFRKRF